MAAKVNTVDYKAIVSAKFDKAWEHLVKLQKHHMMPSSHKIHTPRAFTKELVEEMLMNADTTKNILVLYNVEFVLELLEQNRLMGEKTSQENITFLSDDKEKTAWLEKMGVKIITRIDDVAKGKYDVVIGNPPYDAPIPGTKVTKKIWPMLTKKAITFVADGGYLVWVIPTGWLKGNNAATKAVRTALTTVMNTELVDTRADNYFKQGIEIAAIVAKKEAYTGNTRVILADDSESTYDITDGYAKTAEQLFVEGINNKITSSADQIVLGMGDRDSDSIDATFSEVADAEFRYDCIKSSAKRGKGYTNKVVSNDGVLKIGLNISSSFYNKDADDNNMPITTTAFGALMYYLPVEDKNEGELYRKYFSSKAIRFLAATYKKTNGWCIAVKSHSIPQYDVHNNKLDDASLYSHFGFTAEEIAYIENTIK